MATETKTKTFYPGEHEGFNSGDGKSISDPMNHVGKGTHNDTYADISAFWTTAYAYWRFDVSIIPDNATIDSVECKARVCLSNDSLCNGKIQLFSGDIAKGKAASIKETSPHVYKLSKEPWTRSELNSVRLKTSIQSTKANIRSIHIYGADLTVTYTYQSQKFMLKTGGAWADVARVFKKVSGIWVEQTKLANVVDQTKGLVNGGEYVVELPEGYTRLEYIESTGSQWFNLGFKPNSNTRVVADVEMQSTSAQQTIFGARTAYTSKAWCAWTATNNNGYQTDYGSQAEITNGPASNGRHLIDKNKNVLIVNGTTIHTHTAETFQSDYDLYLLQVNNAGNSMSSYPFKGKLFSCQVYDADTLIRSCVPCINASGVVGVYDIANSVFYRSASGTDFATPGSGG